MTLQSQSIRSSSVPRSSETLVRLRRRGQRRLLGMFLMVLLVGGGFIYLIRYRDGGSGAGPQTAKADTNAAPSGTTKTGAAIGPAVDPLAQNVPPVKFTQPKPATPELVMSNARPKSAASGTPASGGTLIPSGPIPSESPLAGSTTPPTRPPTTAPTPAAANPAPANPSAGAANNPLVPLPGGGAANGETTGLPADLTQAMNSADQAMSARKPVEARAQLNKVLMDPRTSAKDRAGVRQYMAQINQDLVFSPTVFASDPIAEKYTVVSGDNLVKIARKTSSVTESTLIARINRMSNPNALQVGQSLKIIKGPFHAVVSKSGYRMDIYSGSAPSPSSLDMSGLPEGAEPGWMYICSFPVGLGEKDGTPIANFAVKENKLVNPTWANPRTGESFGADDPKNPIGERWIGLAGLDEKSKGYAKYGIHGTIQPESIGNNMSMGCVRMRAEDVEIVYELLMPKVSVVKIVP